MDLNRVRKIYLYDGVGERWFSAGDVKDHLVNWLPWLSVEIREDLARYGMSSGPVEKGREEKEASLAGRLCEMRVINPMREVSGRRPLKPELDYEMRVLSGETRPSAGVLYDGNDLQRAQFSLLPGPERGLDTIHIWFTERLVATWDENDRRYHARVIVCGWPAIISTSGMVQAPAREREYYVARRLGVPQSEPASSEEGEYLRREDPRTSEVAKGYAMQAVFYALTGEAFCDDPTCRLFNAHWQKEMLKAQLGGADYCARHREMLKSWSEMTRQSYS